MSPSQSPSAMYEELVAAIVKAVPGVRYRQCNICGEIWSSEVRGYCGKCQAFMGAECPIHSRRIRLADVLLAFNALERVQGFVGTQGYALDVVLILEHWNLRQDSLDQQSPETIAFLHQLLC
jgi:hypothetical protein